MSGALEALRTGVDIYRSALPDSPRLASSLFLLGDVLQRNGRPAEALPYLEGAQMIWGKSPPSNPKDLEKLDVAIVTTRAALRK